jgi:hypothetical protein
MKHLIVDKLQTGDILGITSMWPPSATIRHRTWPGRSPFDMGCATHVAVVCDRGGGLFYAAGMLPGGLKLKELHDYDRGPGSWGDHVCCVRRMKELQFDVVDSVAKRDSLNEWLIKMHSFGVRYGFEELFRFYWPQIKDDPYELICSQMVVQAMLYLMVRMPEEWKAKGALVSPADIQRWDGFVSVEGAVV